MSSVASAGSSIDVFLSLASSAQAEGRVVSLGPRGGDMTASMSMCTFLRAGQPAAKLKKTMGKGRAVVGRVGWNDGAFESRRGGQSNQGKHIALRRKGDGLGLFDDVEP